MLAILPTTFCLGATLPTLAQALATIGTIGRRGSLLYAVNTAGGVLGAAAAGFGLPVLVGVRASYAFAAGASLLAGIVAIIIGDRQEHESVIGLSEDSDISSAPRARLRLVAGVAGALGLGLEVLWTHLFAQVFHNSVYSFTAIIVVFLLAIAIGTALDAFMLRYAEPNTVAATALVVAAGATIGGFWLFLYLTDELNYVGMRTGLLEYLVRIITLAAVTIGPAAIASGMILPALWAAWKERTSVAHPLGNLSAANLFGGIVGAMTTGFLIIPSLGIRGSLLVASVLYVLLADLLAQPQSRLRPLAYTVLLAIVIANPLRTPLVHFLSKGDILREMLEAANGIVTVTDGGGGNLQLRQDNFYVLGGSAAAANERRQGLLPLLLHPDPQHVAFIGLATGISASAGPALGVKETTVIELLPEVATAARAHFAPWNAKLLERADVHLVLDDGRRYLAGSRNSFDVIVSDLFVPWNPGTGNLYAREMYETAARRLAPGGLFCQWLPLYQLTREEFDVIVRTFLSVFPQVSLWRDDFYSELPVVGLVGQLAAKPLDLSRIHERALHLPDWGKDSLFSTLRGVLMLYAGRLSAAPDLFGATPLNTDDNPLIEFLAPKLTRVNATSNTDWFTGQSLASFYDILDQRLGSTPDPLVLASKQISAARQAGTALYHYAVAAARHDDIAARRYETDVRALVPEVVALGDYNPKTKEKSEDQQALATLRRQQETLRQQLEEMQRRLSRLSASEKTSDDRTP